MPRKLKENIFPDIRRQVHAIVNWNHAILPFQWQVAGPAVEFEAVLEGFEAADTLAFQVQT